MNEEEKYNYKKLINDLKRMLVKIYENNEEKSICENEKLIQLSKQADYLLVKFLEDYIEE